MNFKIIFSKISLSLLLIVSLTSNVAEAQFFQGNDFFEKSSNEKEKSNFLIEEKDDLPFINIDLSEDANFVFLNLNLQKFNNSLLGISFNLHFNNEALEYIDYKVSEELKNAFPLELVHLDRNRLITGLAFKTDSDLPQIKEVKSFVQFRFKKRAEAKLNFYFSKTNIATYADGRRLNLEANWTDYLAEEPSQYVLGFLSKDFLKQDFKELIFTFTILFVVLSLSLLGFFYLKRFKLVS